MGDAHIYVNTTKGGEGEGGHKRWKRKSQIEMDRENTIP